MKRYDVETGRKVHTFIDDCVKDGDLYIRSVCFSPDGQHLATGICLLTRLFTLLTPVI